MAASATEPMRTPESSGVQSRTRTRSACCITQRCAVVGQHVAPQRRRRDGVLAGGERHERDARDLRAPGPGPAEVVHADARQQRRHELHDDPEPRVRPEHRHDVVEQRGRPDEGERPDRPLRRQRAHERGDGDDRRGPARARRDAGRRVRRTQPPRRRRRARARRLPSRGSPAVRAAPRGRPRRSRRDARSRRAADARPAAPDSSTISRCSGTDRREGTRRPRGSTTTAPAAYDAYAIPAAGDEHETPDGDAQPAHRSVRLPGA